MIRKFTLTCKLLFTPHLSASTLYRNQIKSINPGREVCPFCSSRGNCILFDSYNRYVVDFKDGTPTTFTLEVQRVQCTSCKSTHAILTDGLVPYCTYSLFFILRVLGWYFSHQMTIAKICEKAMISASTLYHWVHLFEKHKELWLGLLESAALSACRFYEHLLELDKYSSFSESFYKHTLFSFLQFHANPANCCCRPGGGV